MPRMKSRPQPPHYPRLNTRLHPHPRRTLLRALLAVGAGGLLAACGPRSPFAGIDITGASYA
jgi:protein SCO1/2